MEFYEYETTHNNIDISNEFQYAEFDKYEESETVEIDISELINQNMSAESNIEFSTKAQDIGFHNASSELTDTNITSHYSKCNQQFTCC